MPTQGNPGVTRVYFCHGKRKGWKWRCISNNRKIVASCANQLFNRPHDAKRAARKFGAPGFRVVVDKPKRSRS